MKSSHKVIKASQADGQATELTFADLAHPAGKNWLPETLSKGEAVRWEPEDLYGLDDGSTETSPSSSVNDWSPPELDLVGRGTGRQGPGGRAGLESAILSPGQRIMHQARQEAKIIIQQAEQRAKEIARQAHEDGMAAGRSEVAEALASASALLEELRTAINDLLAQSEGTVLSLVKEIAQTLFGSGIALEQDVLHEAFASAVAQAKSLGDLRVHVNPEDKATIDPEWGERLAMLSDQHIEWIPNEQIRRGGCKIEARDGTVDASIEMKLQTVMDMLDGLLNGVEESQ